MFKWLSLLRPRTEQEMCERRVRNVLTRLKIEDFHFNWDRNSCYIDFQYQEQSYRMEHSIEKAKDKGVYGLKNGLDCLMELVYSLEDLCQIIDRGTYKLETWVAGMKPVYSEDETPEFQEGYEDHKSFRNLIRMR